MSVLPIISSPNSDGSTPNEHLPPFESIQSPNFKRNGIDGQTFTTLINCCYSEIVHWRRNLFKKFLRGRQVKLSRVSWLVCSWNTVKDLQWRWSLSKLQWCFPPYCFKNRTIMFTTSPAALICGSRVRLKNCCQKAAQFNISSRQVIRVKNSWSCCRRPHSNYLGVFLRFRRTLAEVITFGEGSAHEF